MKIKLAAASLLAASLASAAVFADLDPKFYVGGEAQFNKFKYDQKSFLNRLTTNGKNPITKKSSPGAGLFVGSRLNEYFGLEAGISASRAVKGSWNETLANNIANFQNSGNVKLENRNIYADVLGYVPVACDVDLIGSVGVGVLNTKWSVSRNQNLNALGGLLNANAQESANGKHSKTGLRLGAGVQYKFDDNIGARLMVRYQKGNKIIKNNTQAGLGLFYQF